MYIDLIGKYQNDRIKKYLKVQYNVSCNVYTELYLY